MELARVAGVFANQAVFTATGFRPAGRALVHALGSDDENVRVIAGMALVRSGMRAEPLLEEALERRENLPMVLSILGDIGDPACAPVIARFTADPDPEAARAAHDALRVLHAPADRPTPGLTGRRRCGRRRAPATLSPPAPARSRPPSPPAPGTAPAR